MFKINTGSGFNGFQMTFENGWTVSVQFGKFNYSRQHHADPFSAESAEIAAWDKDGNWHNFGTDTVSGHCSPEEVANFIHLISRR